MLADKKEQHRQYWRERRERWEWSPDVRRDSVIAVITGIVALILIHGQNIFENVRVPVTSAVVAVVAYELLSSAWKFFVTVPRDMYCEAQDLIATLQSQGHMVAFIEQTNVGQIAGMPHTLSFILVVKVINQGRPSIADHWQLSVIVNDKEFTGAMQVLAGQVITKGTYGTARYSGEDALYNKTVVRPLPEGGMVTGVLFYSIDTNLSPKEVADHAIYKLTFVDAFGNEYSAENRAKDPGGPLYYAGLKPPEMKPPEAKPQSQE